MKAISQQALAFLAAWVGDGPWRSKSVLAALAATVIGLGFWISDVKPASPQTEPVSVATNAPGATSPAPAAPPAEGHGNWSRPFPVYVRLAASYVAGYCLGWFFRKLRRLLLVAVALVIALLALGKFAGCETTRTQERVKRSGEWMQREAKSAENYFKHLLPSAGAGGIGAGFGFRRRRKAAASVRPAD